MIDSDEIINGVRFQIRKYSLNNFYNALARHLQFVFDFWEVLKRVTRKSSKWQLLQKNIFTFGAAKTKCQQRAQVFQLIWIDLNPFKMIKKVWFEKARELTLQSHLKSVSLVKKSIKSWFLKFFWKKAFTLDQISQTF